MACGRIGFDPLGAVGDARGPGDGGGGSATATVNTVGYAWLAAPIAGLTIVVADATGALQRSFASTGSDVVAIEPGWMIAAIVVGLDGSQTVVVVDDVQA